MTSIETFMALLGSLILSMKLIKSVVSLRYEACSCAMGLIRWSTNTEIRSVRPEHPDIGLPTGVGLWILVSV